MTAPNPKRYRHTCACDYAATPLHWALFSTRLSLPSRGGLVIDPATGKPKEQMYLVCIACVHNRFAEGWAEYEGWKAEVGRRNGRPRGMRLNNDCHER